MKTLTGHHWTTHGLADPGLFAGLGFIFTHSKIGEGVDPSRLIGFLIGAVAIASLGLALWYVFV